MASKGFKHSKKRNCGLVYEFLLRKMSQSLLQNDDVGYRTALRLVKKYYHTGSVLDGERRLFDAIVDTRGASEKVARGVIEEVISSAKNLDFRLIDIKKSNLLKDVNRSFGKKFFDEFRLEDYRSYASIQLLVNSCAQGSTIVEGVQRIQLREALIVYMMSSPEQKKLAPTADNLAYSIAVKKFNERYNDALSSDQKSILKEYVMSLADEDKGPKKLGSYLSKVRLRVMERLGDARLVREVVEDPTMGKRLVEAEDILKRMDLVTAGEREVEDLMLFIRLTEEVSSGE
jgi:hypothetical protein